MEGHWGGWVGAQALKFITESIKFNWNFQQGGGGVRIGGQHLLLEGMDIFWSNTLVTRKVIYGSSFVIE